MMNETGGKTVALAAGAALMAMAMLAHPASAETQHQAQAHQHVHKQVAGQQAGQFLKELFTAAIDVAAHAAQTASDTVHHNGRNVMDTAAKARGFVRDTVSGVLGNARKLSSMVGDVMPFTEHNHYEAGAAPREKKAE